VEHISLYRFADGGLDALERERMPGQHDEKAGRNGEGEEVAEA
jgi:hypothetical protein